MKSLALTLALLAAGYTIEIASRWQVFEIEPARGRVVSHPTWLDNDGAYYRLTILSILQDGDLDLHNQFARAPIYQIRHNVSLGARGEWYPKHPLLLPLLAIPFFLIAGDVGLLAFNVLALLGLCAVMWALARRVASEAAALLVVFVLGYFTFLRHNAYDFSTDVLSTLLVAAAVLLLLRDRDAWAGALLGLAMWTRWNNAVFIPVGLLLARQRLRFLLALAPPCAALLALNQYMFGSWHVTPYDRVVHIDALGQASLEPSHRGFLGWPSLGTLWDQLTAPRIGLFPTSPPLLLAVPGFALLRGRDLLVAGAFCFAQLAFSSGYQDWRAPFGPRYLMLVIALGAVPSAALVDRALAWAAARKTTAKPEQRS
jgi:4-amino-4-deoxy-L-arabinose transferase-like glycosyltransferase